jgi:hypothetical protein
MAWARSSECFVALRARNRFLTLAAMFLRATSPKSHQGTSLWILFGLLLCCCAGCGPTPHEYLSLQIQWLEVYSKTNFAASEKTLNTWKEYIQKNRNHKVGNISWDFQESVVRARLAKVHIARKQVAEARTEMDKGFALWLKSERKQESPNTRKDYLIYVYTSMDNNLPMVWRINPPKGLDAVE